MKNDSFDDFIDAIIEADAPIETKTSTQQKKFPCGQCAGTGIYNGTRIHQDKAHCFACRGTGFFKTDPRKLAQDRKNRAQNKQAKLQAALDGFKEAHPGMFAELCEANAVGSTNAFIASLADKLFRYGSLTENQVAAWYRGKAKLAEIKAERDKERKERSIAVDLAPIIEMFATAQASGYKKPIYRANDLRIKPAKGGALYVLTELRTESGHFGEQPGYEGKIVDGDFHPARACAEDTAAKLKAIAADPKGEAIRHGQRTGRCSCCGRELTKHASIEAGIGPVCAEKWGL